MKENKNIERLFQEKFKDFEVTPPDFVWDNIQEKLNPEKKKRRVIPFWFKASGIAASFLALFTIIYFSTNTNSSEFNTDGFQKESNSVSKTNEDLNSSNSNNPQNNLATPNLENSNNTVSTNSEASNNSENKIDGNSSERNSKFNSTISTNTISSKSIPSAKGNTSKGNSYNRKNKNTTWKNNLAVAPNSKQKNKSKKSNSFITNDLDFNRSENFITQNDKNTTSTQKTNNSFNSTENTGSSNTTVTTTNSSILTDNTAVINNNTLTVVEEPKVDSIALATVAIEENPLEKLLREKEKKVAPEKEDFSKWAVNSYVSPLYLNSFSEGSPLSQEFTSNNKTYNNTTSVGVGLTYQLNKKLAVRTGVGNLNLDYSTNDIVFYSSYDDQTGKSDANIKRNNNGKYLVLRNQIEKTVNLGENEIFISNLNEGNLNQKIQYIEIPMEMSYALVDKKFGISVIGGMSTLLLTKNSVSVDTDNGQMEIGKASNLSPVHFSSNIGLGFRYNFLKNFQANVEPTLKYQINTFNENAGNFKPYFIGINTGISYKF